MKIAQSLFVATIAAAMMLAGCSKQGSVNTTAIEQSFKSADSAIQTTAQKAVDAVKAQDYSGALSQLQTLASNVKLTPEQQQAIKDVMAQVQKVLTDTASKAAGAANKAAGDLQKSLPK